MAANTYPTQASLATKYIPGGQLVDIATATTSYAPIPSQGVVIDAFATCSGVLNGDAIVTVKKLSSAVSTTIGTITCASSGSAAGTTTAMVISGTEAACSVQRGDTILFESDGGGSTTAIANFLLVVRET